MLRSYSGDSLKRPLFSRKLPVRILQLMHALKMESKVGDVYTHCCGKTLKTTGITVASMIPVNNVKLGIAVSTQRWSMETARPGTSSPEAGVQPRAHTRLFANGRAVVSNIGYSPRRRTPDQRMEKRCRLPDVWRRIR